MMNSKNVLHCLSRLSDSDLAVFHIVLFWVSIAYLADLFYFKFSNTGEKLLFIMSAPVACSMVIFLVLNLIKILTRGKGHVTDPVYGLFYYYKLRNCPRDGYIYFVRRITDGVYKIGKTSDLSTRFRGLLREYGVVSVIAIWEVPSCNLFEKVALEITEELTYEENGHRELRIMDDFRRWEFVNNFTKYIIEADTLAEKKPEQVNLIV